MQISKFNFYELHMPLVSPFKTSYGVQHQRKIIIVEAIDKDGTKGYGECVTLEHPLYTEEFTKSALLVMTEYFAPTIIGTPMTHPKEIFQLLKPFKRHQMAKSGVEGAVWDIYAKQQGITLSEAIGGSRKDIDVGVAIGLEETNEGVIQVIEKRLNEGYKRFKVKIKPNRDFTLIRDIRAVYPNLPLMADANAAYTLDDLKRLKSLDPFHLMMIEQPLSHDDLIDHSALQKELSTPICLDESIVSYDSARAAIQLGACKIINIKIGRVGGITEAVKIHDLAAHHNIPVWCGGMLESGVGRMHNIALATLPNFSIPGDISSSNRYWHQDIITPEVKAKNGKVKVSHQNGIGADINFEVLKKYLVYTHTVTSNAPNFNF